MVTNVDVLRSGVTDIVLRECDGGLVVRIDLCWALLGEGEFGEECAEPYCMSSSELQEYTPGYASLYPYPYP